MNAGYYICVLLLCALAHAEYDANAETFNGPNCFRQLPYVKENSDAVQTCLLNGCQSTGGSQGLPWDTCGLCIGACWSLVSSGASAITIYATSVGQCQLYAKATSAANDGQTVYSMSSYHNFDGACTLLAGGDRATIKWPIAINYDNWCWNHANTVCAPGAFLMSSPDVRVCDGNPIDEGPNYFALMASTSTDGPTVIMCWGNGCYDNNLPKSVTSTLTCQDIIKNQGGKIVKACSTTSGTESTVGTTFGVGATVGFEGWSPSATTSVSAEYSTSYSVSSSVTCG